MGHEISQFDRIKSRLRHFAFTQIGQVGACKLKGVVVMCASLVAPTLGSAPVGAIVLEAHMPCFSSGTRIATPQGERMIETIEVGDRIITRDNGMQTVRWVGTCVLRSADWAKRGALKPIMLQKGALGKGLPEQDMLVSPEQRVLICNEQTEMHFEDREVLVPAKHLTMLDGIDVVEPMTDIVYIQIQFDHHEVILCDGIWTESFQPQDAKGRAITAGQGVEMAMMFPDAATTLEPVSSARRSLRRGEVEMLFK